MTTLNWNNVLCFTAGAALGSFVTWMIFKRKFDQIEWVEELENDGEKEEEDHSKDIVLPGCNEKPPLSEYKHLLDEFRYGTRQLNVDEDGEDEDDEDEEVDDEYYEDEEEEMEEEMAKEPYVVSPKEFDTVDGYDVETLTYYADGVLTDWHDEVIEDVDEVVGSESLTHFGEYEKDTVYVRNEKHKCDYEIQRDTRNYNDLDQHRMED